MIPITLLMADAKNLSFVYIIKKICLMKCNNFDEDQCFTCCFNSDGTKTILNAPINTLYRCIRL